MRSGGRQSGWNWPCISNCISVLTAEDTALTFVTSQHDALVGVRVVAGSDVIILRALPRTHGG